MDNERLKIHRGDIFWVKSKNLKDGSIQFKSRPYIIISNNFANFKSFVLTAIPLTSNLQKKKLPTHCEVVCFKNGIRPAKNIALCEQITSISIENIEYYICRLTENELKEVEKCIKIQIGIE